MIAYLVCIAVTTADPAAPAEPPVTAAETSLGQTPTPAAPSVPVALQAALGTGPGVTSWEGDRAIYGTASLGLCLWDVLVLQARVRTGYATVDDRQLTALMLGALLRYPLEVWRPYVRGALMHQHEESLAAIGDKPLNALFGVGPGIRHRYGAEAAVGIDRPVWRSGRGAIFLGGEAFTGVLTYSSGPTLTVGAQLMAAYEYTL